MSEKFRKDGIVHDYMAFNDLLNVSFTGSFDGAYGKPICSTTIIRMSKDDKPVGFTISGFKRGYEDNVLVKATKSNDFPYDKDEYMQLLDELYDYYFAGQSEDKDKLIDELRREIAYLRNEVALYSRAFRLLRGCDMDEVISYIANVDLATTLFNDLWENGFMKEYLDRLE